jgi:hypothetical protein
MTQGELIIEEFKVLQLIMFFRRKVEQVVREGDFSNETFTIIADLDSQLKRLQIEMTAIITK